MLTRLRDLTQGRVPPVRLPGGLADTGSEIRLAPDRALQAFYFSVVFWGEAHRRYFVDFLLASLLSPQNLPALDLRRASKFLIATPMADWLAVRDDPRVQRLASLMEIVHFDLPSAPPGEGKMMTMSRGHKIVSERCFRDRVYGVYLTPDMILADGAIATLQRLSDAGKNVVLATAIRFSQDPMVEQMRKEGIFKSGEPIVIPPRTLVRIGLANLHSETLRYEFDAKWFTNSPISVYSWVRGGNGIVIHSLSWAPLLVNYNAIEQHDSSTFDEWTLDGDYVHRNFGSTDGIHVVRDSDELMMISFTREADMHYDLSNDVEFIKSLPIVGTRYKRGLVKSICNSSTMDPLKRQIFQQPTYFHWSELNWIWRLTAWHVSRRILCGPTGLPGRGLVRFLRFVGRIGPIKMLIDLNRVPASRLFTAMREFKRRATWYYQHRRFLFWRIKEKLGIAERGPDCNDPSWNDPAFGLANPIYSLGMLPEQCRWHYRHRRFVWWRIMERRGRVGPGPDCDDPSWFEPAFGVVNPIYSLRILWEQYTRRSKRA